MTDVVRSDPALVPLDDLDSDALDALPFGVIQVDGAGKVLFYSAGRAGFSGRPVASVVGRDFFRDVARPARTCRGFTAAS